MKVGTRIIYTIAGQSYSGKIVQDQGRIKLIRLDGHKYSIPADTKRLKPEEEKS
jgi:hypothetical protein